MDSADILALPNASSRPEYLEDISPRRVTLEYYDREHTSLRRYLVFLGIEAETAAEIVQECFLKLHEHLLSGGDQTNLRAWLYRVAHNLGRNWQTSNRVSRTESLNEAVFVNEKAAKDASAEEDLLAREQTARLKDAIEELSAAQRECLILRSQGLKYREIAQVLNLSVSTVGENIQRGLGRLKDCL